jgi:CubicO group peptidase (beta-lactamase class C family)
MGTTVEIRSGSGDHPQWSDALPINVPQLITFRWSTSERGVTSAQWKVTEAQRPFSTLTVGVLTGAPNPAHVQLFDIDFATFLPLIPPTTPQAYHVRIIPFVGRSELTPSPPVKISYVPPVGPPQFQPEFDIDQFEENLVSRLQAGKAVGYSYAIYQDLDLQKAGAGGVAVAPKVAQSPDRRMTTMSMTKTITATAVMRAMEEMRADGKQISIDSPISSYLPSDWVLGPRVSDMTFKHLLTHTSGLRPVKTDADPDPDTYNNLQRTIKAGAQKADFGVPFYANANFCLFRIIIPYMTGYVGTGAPSTEATATGLQYVGYVKKHVLKPIGLGSISVVPTGPTPYTRYYPDWSDTTEFYEDKIGDIPIQRTGAGYWHMSAKEFAKFIASLRSGLIVSAETFAIMREPSVVFIGSNSLGLGMYGQKSTYGWYYDHNGGLPASCGDWMIFPNGITAVILVNSPLWGSPAEVIVRDAFNNAWKNIG